MGRGLSPFQLRGGVVALLRSFQLPLFVGWSIPTCREEVTPHVRVAPASVDRVRYALVRSAHVPTNRTVGASTALAQLDRLVTGTAAAEIMATNVASTSTPGCSASNFRTQRQEALETS